MVNFCLIFRQNSGRRDSLSGVPGYRMRDIRLNPVQPFPGRHPGDREMLARDHRIDELEDHAKDVIVIPDRVGRPVWWRLLSYAKQT